MAPPHRDRLSPIRVAPQVRQGPGSSLDRSDGRQAMFSVKDKVAVVTGGGSGIGLATVKRMLAAEARVAFCTRSDNSELAEQLGAMFIRADVSDEGQVSALMSQVRDRLGPIDVLVNNAGIWDMDSPVETGDSGAFRRNLEVNVLGTLHCIKHGAPLMNDGGVIINISSLAAHIALPGYGPYSVSKAGQSAVTRTAAIELGDRGIRVVDIAPGTVATENLANEADTEAEIAAFNNLTPLRRICEMDEVAAAVHFLASDDCRYISGSAMILDGGMLAGLSVGLCEMLVPASE